MTNSSIHSLEIAHDRIDPLVMEVMRKVDAIATEQKLSYFLAGATAREVILRHVFGRAPGRRTLDVDFAIAVHDWQGFQNLKATLIDKAGFEPDAKNIQRLKYPSNEAVIVDLIPFGDIETVDRTIVWPPDGDTVMQVAGFTDALASALQVKLDDSLTLPVVCIPALIVLKLFAWMDRRHKSNKDADDIFAILKQYGEAGNEDRLYGEYSGLLEEEEFDVELAGARLAGIDAAAVISDDTLARVSEILKSEQDIEHLLRHIIATGGGIEGDRSGRCEMLVSKFREGLLRAK